MSVNGNEQETTISFSKTEQTCCMWTSDTCMIARMDKLVKKYPDVYRCVGVGTVRGEVVNKEYEYPKKYAYPKKPRPPMSEEQKEKARKRMEKMFAGKSADKAEENLEEVEEDLEDCLDEEDEEDTREDAE